MVLLRPAPKPNKSKSADMIEESKERRKVGQAVPDEITIKPTRSRLKQTH
jgi:hypothetical protein